MTIDEAVRISLRNLQRNDYDAKDATGFCAYELTREEYAEVLSRVSAAWELTVAEAEDITAGEP